MDPAAEALRHVSILKSSANKITSPTRTRSCCRCLPLAFSTSIRPFPLDFHRLAITKSAVRLGSSRTATWCRHPSRCYCAALAAPRSVTPFVERGTLHVPRKQVNKMPWNGTTGFRFDTSSVIANAPDASGVYALFNQGVWVYIGESQNIRERLLQHIANEQNACVRRSNPQWFAYEPVLPVYRVVRQDQLILELHPTCNQRLG